MKAIRIHQHGGANRLTYEDVPEPRSARGEVIVRLKACALNYRDIEGRVGWRGIRKLAMLLPQILGADGAGAVVQVGEDAEAVKPGDEVLLTHVLGSGHCSYCLAGKHHYASVSGFDYYLGLVLDGDMARRPRVHFPGALHHMISPGSQHGFRGGKEA